MIGKLVILATNIAINDQRRIYGIVTGTRFIHGERIQGEFIAKQRGPALGFSFGLPDIVKEGPGWVEISHFWYHELRRLRE